MKKITGLVIWSALTGASLQGAQDAGKAAGAINAVLGQFQQDVPGRDQFVADELPARFGSGAQPSAAEYELKMQEAWDEVNRQPEDHVARSADFQAAFTRLEQEFQTRRRSDSLDAMLAVVKPAVANWQTLQDPFVNAHALFFVSQYEQAISDYLRQLQAGGGTAEQIRKAYVGLGESHLALGHLVAGFKQRERRISGQAYSLDKLWDGKTSLDEQTLVIYPEGGFGDLAFFQVRYVPIIQRVYPRCKIVLEGNFPQRSIYSFLSNVEIVAPGACKNYDHAIHGMSLPCYFSNNGNEPTDVDSIPHHAYLQARSDLVAQWEQYLQVHCIDKGVMPIGIFWAASANPGGVFRSYERDIDPTLLITSLAACGNVALFNLQGPGSDAVVAKHHDVLINFDDFDKKAGPFQDTAAFMQALKNKGGCVVGIDTGALNFAGAIGVETIALLPAYADWRWGVNQEQSVWFPSMTLIRQMQQGDWRPVIDRVQEIIRRKIVAGTLD